jgi:hemerythrin-like domain-containing protein
MELTQELAAEHKAVLIALRILERVAEAIVAGDEPARQHMEQLLDFFIGFVDLCHHSKEELVLFPALERRGVKRVGGPIGVLLAEHESARSQVRAMSGALARVRKMEPGAARDLKEHALTYRDLLWTHINKENTVLFPTAEETIPSDVAADLASRFDEIEHDRVGDGKHESYHAMIAGLKQTYGFV